MENEVTSLYHSLINAWNERTASEMAGFFADEGEMIGFDGSQVIGRDEILAHLEPIFRDHPTAPFVTKVKSVREISENAVMLRAIAGMIPPGKSDLVPELNAHQTLIAVKSNDRWKIELFQNTPAQFHGRPELVEQMTAELRKAIK